VSGAPSALRVALALGAVYLFWGSTAPAMKLAVQTLPPFALVSVRFLAGGSVLWLIARLRRVPLPQQREWATSLVTASLLLVASNALFCWSLQTMPSGLGSLFFALSPLWMTLFAAAFDGERIVPLAIAGLVLGIGGMLAIFVPGAAHGLPLSGIVVDLFASVAWALGSIVQRRFRSTDLVQTSAMQMLLAAPVCEALSLATAEHPRVLAASAASLASLAYLIVFGSVVGFSAYLWLLRNVPTTLAATYAYVNPVVSIALATLFLHESLSWNAALGAALVVAGVACMMLAPRPRRRLAEAA